jgi:hypothetical protein
VEGTGGWKKLHDVELHVTLTRYYWGDQIEDVMSMTCGSYTEKRNTYRISVGKLKETCHLEDLGADGKLKYLKYLIQIEWEGVDWIHLALVRDKWSDVVNTVG